MPVKRREEAKKEETDAYITIIVVLKITDLILRKNGTLKVCVCVFKILLRGCEKEHT